MHDARLRSQFHSTSKGEAIPGLSHEETLALIALRGPVDLASPARHPEWLEARGRLAVSLTAMVHQIALEYAWFGELDDLVKAGQCGVLIGIDRYDPSFETKLPTYVGYWIRNEILESLPTLHASVRVPRNTYAASFKLSKAVEARREITADERRLLARVQAALACVGRGGSPDDRGPGGHPPLDDLLAPSDDLEEADEVLDARTIRVALDEVLDAREMEVLDRRLGLTREWGAEGTFRAIGDRFGVTRERARQIAAAAIAKARRSIGIDDPAPSRSRSSGGYVGVYAQGRKFRGRINQPMPGGPPKGVWLAAHATALEAAMARELEIHRTGWPNRLNFPARAAEFRAELAGGAVAEKRRRAVAC